MDLQLHGKRCVVLGGSRGIGRAIALGLAAEGADVAVCARGAEVRPTTRLPEACKRSQLIGPYMLSMSTITSSASASGSSRQWPARRSLASANADLSAVSVAGSIPARPMVNDITGVR